MPALPAAVLDLEALGALDGFPAAVDHVVLTFQASPARRDAIAARFPGARIEHAVPASDGPWQAVVEDDLEALARLDEPVEGVPLLDAFRAALRDEVTALRALEQGLAGARHVVAAAGSRSAATLARVRARGGLDVLDEVARPADGDGRTGLLRKVRAAGVRGVALALSSRLDPSHARRARCRFRPRLGPAAAVAVSSYVNATRAAFEALDATGGGPAVLLRSGPGATTGLRVPAGVRGLSLAAALSLDRRRAAAARRDAAARVEAALRRWGRDDDPWAPGTCVGASSFGRALLPVLLPEVVSAVVGLRAVLERTGAGRLVVGDEFAFVDRAALHLARALGRRTASRQHGVLDSHYLRDRVLADEHLAWDAAAVAWLRDRGAVGDRAVRVVARAVRGPSGGARAGEAVVVFLQPTDLVRVPFADWVNETLGAATRAATARGLRVVAKPHPLQTAAGVGATLAPDLRAQVRLVTDASARDLLGGAAVAVTLDSSVAVDCREAGVPCLSTAWYAGTYVADLVRLGYLVPCATPQRLEEAILARTRPGGPP